MCTNTILMFLLCLCNCSINYPTVQMATHAGKCLFLHTIRDDGSNVIVGFKLVSQKAANGLYRCVTEMHSFYRCDTIRNAVASQFSRDLKGTLASLFNEHTTLGMTVKHFVPTCQYLFAYEICALLTVFNIRNSCLIFPFSPQYTTVCILASFLIVSMGLVS